VVQANKAIVGANAFAHESGIHQDGVLKNKRTYEIMDAESIGLVENNIVLGKHSGRHAFRNRLAELGHDNLADDELNRAFIRFKELADKKKEISNADLESIVGDEVTVDINDKFKLVGIQIICGDRNTPTATATMYDEDANEEHTISATGTGPVDAAFKAIRMLLKGAADDIKLLEYTVSSVTAGIDALGEVTVRLQDAHSQKIVYGRASNTDVFVASAHAYMCAINRILATRGSSVLHPQFNTLS